jgi:hypothetical protein
MLPSRCIHEPCRNIEVMRLEYWAPGSVRQSTSSPIGKRVPGGTDSVSSPGISPRLQTDAARGASAPAPCTINHASELAPMSASVTYGVRCVSFSS